MELLKWVCNIWNQPEIRKALLEFLYYIHFMEALGKLDWILVDRKRTVSLMCFANEIFIIKFFCNFPLHLFFIQNNCLSFLDSYQSGVWDWAKI